MDYSVCAKKIVAELGGEKNIKAATHCMTRLRFNLKDESIVNDNKVKAIKGVMGIMKKGGQYQVIIGNAVGDCYKEVAKLGNFGGDNNGAGEKEKVKVTPKTVFNGVLDAISGSMAPILQPLIGCGMVKLILIVWNLIQPDAATASSTYMLLNTLGDACFYFLPIFMAFSSAKKFGCNQYLAAAVAAILVHPDLITQFANVDVMPVTVFGLPVRTGSYTSSIIPALLSTYVLSWVEKFVDKICPKMIKMFVKPTAVMLIMLPITLVVLAPLGGIIGTGLSFAMGWLQSTVGWLAIGLFAALCPFIVMTGMHYAFLPTAIADIGNGIGDGFLLPAMLCSNLAQGAASLAVAIKTKNKELKQVASASGITGMVGGITEPALYGVTLRLKKPMIACVIGGGISGIIAGFGHLTSFAVVSPSLVGIVQFVSPENANNIIFAVIAAAVSIVTTFVATLLIGFDDPVEEEEEETVEAEDTVEPAETVVTNAVVAAPLSGKVVALSEVNDATFADEILGKGMAIIPSEGKVFAPANGEVVTIFDTLHALAMRTEEGVEVLVHVGLDTVQLNGKHFKAHVSDGQKVKKGDLLLEFDMDAIQTEGYEVITPVVITNSAECRSINPVIGRRVKAGDEAIKIA